MATEATLSAELKGGGVSAGGTGATIHVLKVDTGEVTFILKADGELKPESASLMHGGTATPMTLTDDKKSATATVEVDEAAKWGLYSASAKDTNEADVTVKNQVNLNKATSNSDGTPPTGVAEVSSGEYDPDFALKGLVAVAVLAVLGLGLAWLIIRAVSLPAAGTDIPAEVARDGTFTERVAAMIYALVAAAGVAITLVGAWLAALETRGRLTTRKQEAQPGVARGVDVDAAVKVLEVFKFLRGTIAVIVAGVLIVGGALFFTSRLPTSGVPSGGPSDGASAGPVDGPSQGTDAPSQAPPGPQAPGPSANP